ncbi:MAG TPA: hypothetical protein VHD33_05540, partial [Legionellaceae bacterium]|nr:hypothetical protein [Legionellaceae bacterium]
RLPVLVPVLDLSDFEDRSFCTAASAWIFPLGWLINGKTARSLPFVAPKNKSKYFLIVFKAL